MTTYSSRSFFVPHKYGKSASCDMPCRLRFSMRRKWKTISCLWGRAGGWVGMDLIHDHQDQVQAMAVIDEHLGRIIHQRAKCDLTTVAVVCQLLGQPLRKGGRCCSHMPQAARTSSMLLAILGGQNSTCLTFIFLNALKTAG